MSDMEARKWIEEAIKEHWDERCPDFVGDCSTCRIWAEWDRLCGGGWQPIETAPKDGTVFIAFEAGDAYRCNWLEQHDGEGHFSAGWWDHVNDSFENPTHWMPLPTPPQEDEGR